MSSDVQDAAGAATGMSTVPVADDGGVRGLGPLGWARWTWRQLTSMRTALFLLLLFALAAIPGSVFPQRIQKALEVKQYLAQNPFWGGVLDRLGMFDVFSAPWFAAIYVLLFISLTGCVIPRAWSHARILRQPPPAAPRRLSRLPENRSAESDAEPQQVLDAARGVLKQRRWRVRDQAFDGTGGWVAAEKGYARESGNLLFHVALLGILAAVGSGSLFGYSGKVIIVEGKGFADTAGEYDSFTAGRFADGSNLPPFTVTLDKFTADYQRGGEQNGAPRLFSATVTSKSSPDAAAVTTTMGVNEPLELDGVKMFLVGHGYAPTFTIKNADGSAVFSDAVVFLPQDGNFTSTGVVKATSATPQLGLQGVFLPTWASDPTNGPYSSFPAPDDPAVFLAAWTGNVNPADDLAPSVYKLNVSQLKELGIAKLLPGQTWVLPKTGQTVTFTGFKQFASFSVAHDPSKQIALITALLATAGLALSLLVVRRRVWVRVSAGGPGVTVVEVAGLTRSEHSSVADDVDSLLAALPVRDTPTGA